ncbi:MAG: cobalt ECF transporter T component CbiQ [Proteobacteria bacterium]|nr:cobalt ECF transporter T component CbiQ [Pseudomonadota bacterium]
MRFDEEFFNLGYIDKLAYQNTFIHRLDARIKVLISVLFVISVVSFPKYEILRLMPYFLFPVIFIALGDIPVGFLAKRVLIVSGFIFFIALFNPIIDRKVAFYFFNIPVSYGLISFFSIFIKFFLTISILILLVATTSFSGICYALRYFRVPEIFVNQLLFLYRYIFVLFEETMRMVRAKELRSFGNKGGDIKSFIKLTGNLLIKSIERAERIYYAMLSRGFVGSMPYLRKKRIDIYDISFFAISFVFLVFFRFTNISTAIENFIKR